MKRPLVTTFLVLAAAFAAAGCPIYDHENAGCYTDRDCQNGYLCDINGVCYLPSTQAPGCTRPADCLTSETCTVDGSCAPGDCTFHGSRCVSGYVCAQQNDLWACVPSGSEGSGGNGGQSGSSGSGAGGSGTEAGAATM